MTHIMDLVRQSEDYSIGRTDADRDFAAGKMAQRDFGPSPPWWGGATASLQTQYQITFEAVDIGADKTLIARSIGYNERMREHITAKIGEDVVGMAYRKAEDEWSEYARK